jgi:uncharacterized protein YceK
VKKNKFFTKTRNVLAGALAMALAFGLVLTGCGKTVKAQSSSGGQAADAAGAVKEAVKSAAGGGKPAEASDFVYELNEAEDSVVITGIQKDAKFGAHLVVPAEIEGYPVAAFLARYDDYSAKSRNQPPLESVVFPDSIRYLGVSGRFDGIRKEYGYVEFYKFTETYEGASFGGCKSLKSVVFPKSLNIIPRGFVSGCSSLKFEDFTWPEDLEIIGPSAFAENSFTNLVIPEGVKFIGDSLGGAFANSETLKSVTIPDSIVEIGANTFSDCPELAAVNIPAHPIKYTRRTAYDHNWAFLNCPKLGIAAQTAIMDTGYPDF